MNLLDVMIATLALALVTVSAAETWVTAERLVTLTGVDAYVSNCIENDAERLLVGQTPKTSFGTGNEVCTVTIDTQTGVVHLVATCGTIRQDLWVSLQTADSQK